MREHSGSGPREQMAVFADSRCCRSATCLVYLLTLLAAGGAGAALARHEEATRGRLASHSGQLTSEFRSCRQAGGQDCGTVLLQTKQATSRVAFTPNDVDGHGYNSFAAVADGASPLPPTNATGDVEVVATGEHLLQVDCLCRKAKLYWCPQKFISLKTCYSECSQLCGDAGFVGSGCHNWRTLEWYRRSLKPPAWELRFCDEHGPSTA